MTIRLLIIDDHSIVRDGIASIVAATSDIGVVGEACEGAQALDEMRRTHPDVCLLDFSIPGIQGADLIRRLKAENPNTQVLMLSMHKEGEIVSRLLKAGAAGYVTKDAKADILLTAIRKVATGGNFIDPSLVDQMIFEAPKTGQAPHQSLTDREFQILRMLGIGKSVNEIAEGLRLSAKTISSHKTNMMRKLHLRSNADVIRYTLQHNIQ
jgi:DNA-binding NarL/FixJ family response regulator